MSGVFPDSGTGRRLARLVALTGENALERSRELQSELRLDPEGTFHAVRQGLASLPEELADEREFLIRLAGKLEVDPAMRMTLLREELRRPVFEGFSALSAALESMIEISGDPRAVEPVLLDALRSQRGLAAREALLSAYAVESPSRAAELRGEIAAH